ncbi:MAG: Mur ligase family protein, partial [Marmoricola sp.]
MTDVPDAARLAQTYAEVEDALLSRWPETRIDPSLDRIREFLSLLGDPQTGYPMVHLTGTNGKTSTARMIETLVRGLGLRTGRFTSPHLESMTERIVLDGEPLSEEAFVRAFNDVAPYTHLVDAHNAHPLSFFETITAMAYAAFADAPVDAAAVEVGLGGTWDSTNVADGKVAVVTPVAVDHVRYLGETPGQIAHEKAGIIKPGAIVVTAVQNDDVAPVLADRCTEVGATMLREGIDFGVASRVPAVGGQL